MKKFFFLFALILFPITIHAQDETGETAEETSTDELSERQFWQANIPGGTYMVAIDAITSVSSHAYILDGAAVITEVNIDTSGNSLVRFYTITPIAVYENADIENLYDQGIDTLKEVTSSVSSNKSLELTQKTSQTTHAKTVEYQVTDLKSLRKLLRSIQSAFTNNEGRTFTLKSPKQ